MVSGSLESRPVSLRVSRDLSPQEPSETKKISKLDEHLAYFEQKLNFGLYLKWTLPYGFMMIENFSDQQSTTRFGL